MKVPNGKAAIIAMYGQPCKVQMAEVQLPAPIGVLTHIHVHVLIADSVRLAFQEIFDGGHWDTLNEFGGCYCCRPKRGLPGNYSVHSWAVAIDFNPSHNPLGADVKDSDDPHVFTATHPVVIAFNNQGAKWGGSFNGRKDPMHVQFATGY